MIPQVNNFVVFDGFFKERPDYAGKKARWAGLDQSTTPDREGKQARTQFQDSSTYNPQSVHLRNLPVNAGGYHPQNGNTSSIGVVVQPPTTNGVNGHHQNGDKNGQRASSNFY